MTAPPDFVTVLTAARGLLMTKRATRGAAGRIVLRDYDNAKHFDIATVGVTGGLDGLAPALDQLQPQQCVVHGQHIEGAPARHARRLIRPREGSAATLQSASHHWLPIDLDAIDCPSGLDPVADPEGAVDHVVMNVLPVEMRDRDVYWQLTSGAGIKPGIRLRLVFWLDRALTNAEARRWLSGCPGVDGSIYSPNQPIYFAKPVFAAGIADPVPRRSGIMRGERPAVSPPEVIPEPARKLNGAGGGAATVGYETWCSRIGDHDEGDGFFGPIKSAVASWIASNGAKADTGGLRKDLEKTIREAPRDRAAHPDDYIEKRVADLDTLIENIVAMQAAEEAVKGNGSDPAGSAELVKPAVEILTFDDLLTPDLTRRGLVKGLIDRRALVLLVGLPGSGKTFLAMDVGLSVAAGREWFARRVQRGKVVYLAAEAGIGIRNRVAAWALERWDEQSEIEFRAVVSPVDLCHDDAKDVPKLIAAIGAADMVVVDTASRALAGGDKNSPGDMGAFVRKLDLLRDALGCAIIVVHHLGKDASRGARGHSLLYGAADTEITVEKGEGGSVATVTKQRDGPAGIEIGFQLRVVELGQDEDGDAVTTCVVDPLDHVPEMAAKKLSPKMKAALDLLCELVLREGETVPVKSPLGDFEARGVKVEKWREAMAANGRFGPAKSGQFYTAWSRAQDLADGGHIAFGEGCVWPLVTGDQPF